MDSPERQNPSNAYLKYSSLALQLLIGIGAAGWLGHLLDNYLGFEFPVFMLTFGFLAFGGMIYQIYRSLNKDQ
jgi:F0F1-type ATP synthase assembly protein I